MKILLAIFCGLIALFSGGCALILFVGSGYGAMFQSAPLAMIPGGIAALNVLVIVAMFGWAKPQRWAFYVLAALDAVAALIIAVVWADTGTRYPDVNMLAGILLAAVVLKGVLTLVVAQRLPREPQESERP
jgi:hypothetical protein